MSVDNVLHDNLVVQSDQPDHEPPPLPPVSQDEAGDPPPAPELTDSTDEKAAPSEFDLLKEDEECPWGRMGERHWILLALFLGMCCQYVQRSCIVRDDSCQPHDRVRPS
eukprot:COSAG02_NODE_989_length_15437_cov_95.731860_8_plen_109_part_00